MFYFMGIILKILIWVMIAMSILISIILVKHAKREVKGCVKYYIGTILMNLAIIGYLSSEYNNNYVSLEYRFGTDDSIVGQSIAIIFCIMAILLNKHFIQLGKKQINK